ncbi:MAG: hypothetical protein WBZ36_21535 [Candidatus Nitrosopolaris sp.]
MLPTGMATNPFVSSEEEENVICRFLCCLYWRSRNDRDVSENGMMPREIYDRIEPPPDGEELVNRKVQWLVNNCLSSGHIELGDDDRIKITDEGNKRCESIDKRGLAYCSQAP